ncbi:MAG TPA: hemolysin family protein [Cellvibrio sp.]|nr:hemolysin family protein [Cellvibrio sp.]
MDILVLVGLILLNGLFAMSEIAIVTAKKSRLAALAAKGNSSAQAAIKLAEDPTQFLSTVQIGITSIGIMNGIFGESILAEPFALWMQSLGVPVALSDNVATVLVVIVVTYLSIVVGELVPKRIGQVSAERLACTMAKPMQLLALITKPFVDLLSGSTRTLMRVLGFNQKNDQAVTQEDIHAILDEGTHSGVIEHQEHTMVKNVLRLEARPIASLMIPRSDMVYLDTSLPLEENYQRVMQSPHSRFPVCERSNDNIIGVINAKELLAHAISGEEVDLPSLAKPCHLVPESLTGMELLEIFRSSHSQMVFVVDEYGNLKGLVTLQDLLEALTGELGGSSDEDAYIIRREDGSLLLDGMLSIYDLKDCLGIRELPDEGDYQTLSGLIMLLMGKVPSAGERVMVDKWLLEIMDMDGRRVDKVLAQQVEGEEDDSNE